MLLSFALMGTAILVVSLTPSYNAIGVAAPIIVIVARMAQGFALGGEVGPTTAYLLEIAPPQRRALVVSWQPASQQIAATTGALVGVILSKTMAPRGARCLRLARRIPDRGRLSAIRALDAPVAAGDDPAR